MRHPNSRPWLVAFIVSLPLLSVRADATCTDEQIQQNQCVEDAPKQPAGGNGGGKVDIGFGTQPSNPRHPNDGGVIDPPSGGGGNSGGYYGGGSTSDEPVYHPQKPPRQEPADPSSGNVEAKPISNGREANNLGTQGSQQQQDPAQIQAFAPRVHPALSQKNLEDKLRPLLQQTQGPGDMPAASAASPLSWGVDGAVGSAAAQGPVSTAQFQAMMRQGNYAGAERALTQQIIEKPDDALAYRYRGMVRRLEKDYTGALDDSSQALKLNPRDGWARTVRAGALVDLHRYSEAVEEASRAVEMNPSDGKAYYTRAQARKKLGQRDERLADLKRAAELDPEFAAAYKKALAQEDDDVGSVPLKNGTAAASSSNKLDGTIVLYGTAGGGFLLILAGLGLMFLRTGNTGALTRPPMRLADQPLPGALTPTLEGFEIVGKIGEGGMGVVYEAVDRTLRRKVALKEMREHIAADPKQRKRFLREASTVASLKHPHVVEIHSAFENEGKLFLVFEYVNGEALNTRLDRGPIAPGETLGLLRQMAKALDYAHAKGVIHQDLKPANIMVAAEGVKIMDFGIARKVETKSPLTTSSLEIVGTPFYMAPEQESGETVKQSDLFALGVCAYEMLSGRRPFETVPCLFQKMEGKFPPLTDVMPTLPKSVDRVLTKVMAAKPHERHATAQDFVADLEAALCMPAGV